MFLIFRWLNHVERIGREAYMPRVETRMRKDDHRGTKFRVFRVYVWAPFLPAFLPHSSPLFPLQALFTLPPLLPSSPSPRKLRFRYSYDFFILAAMVPEQLNSQSVIWSALSTLLRSRADTSGEFIVILVALSWSYSMIYVLQWCFLGEEGYL